MNAQHDGLYLRVRPTRKVWIYRCHQDGKGVKLGLGRYPVISLAAVRQKVRADGGDPKQEKRTKVEQDRVRRRNTWEARARAWH